MVEREPLKKILYLCYDGLTDPLGQSQVLPYLTELAKRGFDITIISCEKADKFLKHKTLIAAICNKAGIHWQPVKYHQTLPLISQAFTIFKVYQKAVSFQKQVNFNIVHGRSYVVSIVALKLKQRFGLKFIFDTRGFWHEERLGNYRAKPILNQIFQYFNRKEQQFIEQADSIITLNETAKAEISQRKEFQKSKTTIDVIPCCVDYELFTPAIEEDKKKVKQSLGIAADETVLGYVGSIGDALYMLSEMLDFFKIMLHTLDNKARFLILTLGSEKDIFQQAKSKNIDTSSIIVKSATREQVAYYLKSVDFAISFIQPRYEKRGCSPTKMGEYFAMNIPVIANDGVGDVSKIMADTEGGVLIRNFNTESYKNAFNAVFQLKQVLKGIEIREKSKKYYDLTQGVNTYCNIYNRLL